jgi:hypothetical protein
MKILLPILISLFIVVGSADTVQAQNKPQRTSGARAAYGNPAPFKSHIKKNKKSKKKARKAAEKQRQRNDRKPYRRGMPI